MARPPLHRPKRTPTDHQKRIRFLIGFSIFLIIIVVTGLFILINWSQFSAH